MKNRGLLRLFSWVSIIIGVHCFVPQIVNSDIGPCDIYEAGGTPCVAAYSTVRALFDSYNGPLYEVRRSTDHTTRDIGLLSAGGYADANAQDEFCMGTDCRISTIYDQSTMGNHLTKAPGGSEVYGPFNDSEAVANALPVFINGHRAYGVHVTPGGWTVPGQVGYRNTNTTGVAKGDEPESMYMITDGTYVNGACCFNFGNAMMGPWAGGMGSMEAVYFGTNTWWGRGQGEGPWVMADLEVGVYNMGGAGNFSFINTEGNKDNPRAISLPYPFVTAMLKGNSATATDGGPFTLKGGNAQSDTLSTFWDGPFPLGYSPMDRQGGILLGVGGDNSSGAQGNFYEGIMTRGYATTETDNAIQANIIAAGYGRRTIAGPVVTVFQNTDYAGYSVPLPVGSYTTAQLVSYGVMDNDISSIQVANGLQVELFDYDDFQSLLGNYSEDQANFVSLQINDMVSSIRISEVTTALQNSVDRQKGVRWANGA